MDAVSSERKRIERDLHDGAQQGLVNSAMMLGLATDQLRGSNGNGANDPVVEMLDSSMDALRTALSEMRSFSRGLYPTLLTDEGLVPAVEVLVSRAPVPVTLEATEIPRFDEQVEIAAYFVIAEAMTNAFKHADPSRVIIDIGHTDQELVVSVSDDGRGFEEPSDGTGLRSLRDRVAPVDGRLSVATAGGEGTTVSACFPLSDVVGA